MREIGERDVEGGGLSHGGERGRQREREREREREGESERGEGSE
jgi:hypothetical protein